MIVAISGVKNSGKTTLITKIIPIFKKRGYKVATIKHDGHEFEADVKGTDTYLHTEAGAYASAIFSQGQYMVKKRTSITEVDLIPMFKEADVILLEGFKYSTYPKIEVVRQANSEKPICNPQGLIAIATDCDLGLEEIMTIPLNDSSKVVDHIINYFDKRG